MLADGELRYFKDQKAASLSNSVPLKSISLSAVHCAAANPKHANMFVVDMGVERKVKLQAATERERDAWVATIEAAKLRSWAAQEQTAFDEVHGARDPGERGPQQGGAEATLARSEHPRADSDPNRKVDDIHLIPDDTLGMRGKCCAIS